MSFDEWFDKNGELYRKPTSDERYLFEAGAQSRQDEIDELQKRIDEVLAYLGSCHRKIEIEKKYIENLLKGKQND